MDLPDLNFTPCVEHDDEMDKDVGNQMEEDLGDEMEGYATDKMEGDEIFHD